MSHEWANDQTAAVWRWITRTESTEIGYLGDGARGDAQAVRRRAESGIHGGLSGELARIAMRAVDWDQIHSELAYVARTGEGAPDRPSCGRDHGCHATVTPG